MCMLACDACVRKMLETSCRQQQHLNHLFGPIMPFSDIKLEPCVVRLPGVVKDDSSSSSGRRTASAMNCGMSRSHSLAVLKIWIARLKMESMTPPPRGGPSEGGVW